MEEKRETTLRKTREDAKRIMEQARRESDTIIAELKRIKKEAKSAPDAEVAALRKRMEEGIDSLTEGLKQEVDTGEAPKQVKPGDRVRILTIGS